MQPAQPRRTRAPRYLQVAHDLYGPAFEVRDPQDVREAVADWSSLKDAQRGYALAHLLYLNLQAQAATQRLLAELRDHSADMADDLETVARAARHRGRPAENAEVQDVPTTLETTDAKGVEAASRGDGPEASGDAGAEDPASADADAPDAEALIRGDGELSPLAALFNDPDEETHDEAR